MSIAQSHSEASPESPGEPGLARDDERLPANARPLGPDSLVWRHFADGRMLLLGPRAAVLQNMLPSLGQGVEDHSVWFDETMARLQRSIPPIFNTVYAADGERVGRQVRDFHKPIKGKLPDGQPYHALNPQTYYWAHATFIEHVITATDTFIRRLSEAEKAQLFEESITWYWRYGVSATGTPQTWEEFQAYWRQALAERLVPHRIAAYGVGYVTKGWPRPRQIPAPIWSVIKWPINTFSAFLTTGGMPAEVRDLLGLPWDDRRERRYQRFAKLCRTLNPLYARLPASLRLHPIARRAYRREGRAA